MKSATPRSRLTLITTLTLWMLSAGMWGCATDLTGTWKGEADLVERNTGDPVQPAPKVTLELTHEHPRVTGTVNFDTAKGPLESLEGKSLKISGMLDGEELILPGYANDSGMIDLIGEAHAEKIEGRVELTVTHEHEHQVFVGTLVATPQ